MSCRQSHLHYFLIWKVSYSVTLYNNRSVSVEHMSLALDYSSDDAETVAKDAFGILSLSSSKKPRVDDSVESNTAAIDSAPHVLTEVSGTPVH